MKWWMALSALLALALAVQYSSAILPTGCEPQTYGTGDKIATYFSSPLCIACWTQKTEIQKFVNDYGDQVMIYEYDHDLCPDKASQPVRGVPAFVIEDEVSYGMKTNEQLKEMMI